MAAATQLPISVSEYLRTSYRPDCDYVDGVVEERNGFETMPFADTSTGIRLDLNSLFASIDDALGDPGKK